MPVQVVHVFLSHWSYDQLYVQPHTRGGRTVVRPTWQGKRILLEIGNVPVNFLSRHNVNSLQSPPGREETFSIISYRDWPHIFLWGFYLAHRMKISMKFPLAREEIFLVITFEDNVNITEEFPLGREETFLGCQHNSKLNSDWILKPLLLQLNQLISNVDTLMSNVDDIRNAKIM